MLSLVQHSCLFTYRIGEVAGDTLINIRARNKRRIMVNYKLLGKLIFRLILVIITRVCPIYLDTDRKVESMTSLQADLNLALLNAQIMGLRQESPEGPLLD